MLFHLNSRKRSLSPGQCSITSVDAEDNPRPLKDEIDILEFVNLNPGNLPCSDILTYLTCLFLQSNDFDYVREIIDATVTALYNEEVEVI